MNVIRLLLGAAGIASVALLAYRQRPPPVISRPVTLATLDREVRSWLSLLPYIPFVRIGLPVHQGRLELAAGDESVRVSLVSSEEGERPRAAQFRQICSAAGRSARDVHASGDEWRIVCELPAAPDVVADLIRTLLRDLYGVQESSVLTAAVPKDCHAR